VVSQFSFRGEIRFLQLVLDKWVRVACRGTKMLDATTVIPKWFVGSVTLCLCGEKRLGLSLSQSPSDVRPRLCVSPLAGLSIFLLATQH